MDKKIDIIPIFKRFIVFNKNRLPLLLITSLVLILSSITLTLQQLLIGDLVDIAIQLNLSRLPMIAFQVVIIFIFSIIFDYICQYLSGKFSKVCNKEMKIHTYNVLLNIKISWLENSKVGDLLSRVNSDLNKFEASLTHLSYQFSTFIIGLVALLACLLINWKLSLISLSLVPILAILQNKTGKPIAKYSHLDAEAGGQAISVSQNLLAGLAVAKAFNIEKQTEEKFSYYIDQSVTATLKYFAIEFLLLPLQIFMSFIPKFLIFGVGGYLVIQQTMSAGQFMSYILLSTIALRPINELSWMFREIYYACGFADRIFNIWDAPKETTFGSNFDVGDHIPVKLENVSFHYDDKDVLLSNFNLTINKGEQVALVGTSGCGKSTILKLLAKFYDIQQGDIKLFQHSINDWKLTSLRKNISYVSQESYIFDGTIYENIILAKPTATDNEIQEIVKLALLDDLDLHGFIGEGGVQLSGGQKQRISIARAMLKDAPLILLDEPTSALDVESEKKVLMALGNLIKNKTSIIVAHRLSAFKHVDRIICMDEGEIIQEGTHDELINTPGLYKNLYMKQSSQTDRGSINEIQ